MRWEMVTLTLRWECYHITEFTEVGQIDKYGIELGELGVFWYFCRIIAALNTSIPRNQDILPARNT